MTQWIIRFGHCRCAFSLHGRRWREKRRYLWAAKTYRQASQLFLVGCGAVDDKGPAVLAMTVLEAAAKRFDNTDALDDWTLEVAFDTAEETDVNILFYIDAVEPPELGIVFDALWAIRAEKGLERPVFSLPLAEVASGSLQIATVRRGYFQALPSQGDNAKMPFTSLSLPSPVGCRWAGSKTMSTMGRGGQCLLAGDASFHACMAMERGERACLSRHLHP